jgi:pimeloyl-ACP methyl ester carboxylesterase
VIALWVITALFCAGLLFEQVGQFIDARRYPAPGRRVAVPGGATLHIYRRGEALGPTVVFEAGISGSSLSWWTAQPLVAEFANAVVYDRAGLGFSAGKLTPRTVANMVAELAAALDTAQVPKPYLLVGHSFGGLLMQAFAHTHADRTSAVVLVDPVAHEEWANADTRQIQRLRLGAKLSRRGAWLARFGVVRAALVMLLLGGRRIAKGVATATAGQGNRAIDRLINEVRKLPPDVQPIVASHWSKARSFTALAAYLECLPESARTAMALRVPREIPLVILSAASATAGELREREAWVAANAKGRHIQVDESGHWLQLDKPELVASVIRETLLGVR